MRYLLSASALVATLCTTATAQLNVVIPDGTALVAGNTSNAFPWGTNASAWPGLRLMAVYGAVNFTNQSVNTPILINRLKWRPDNNAGAVTGGNFTVALVELSTSPTGWAGVTTNYATNHGADRMVVYDATVNGPVVHTATTGTAGWTTSSWCVDIQLPTPFLYDPTLGDLVIDVDYPTGSTAGVGQMDVQGAGSNSSRIFASAAYPAANGTTLNHGPVVEVGYVPASGLFASFTATPTTGAAPLVVNFTDTSYSSGPAGVQAWAWDFENDGTVDSTLQNPSHTYTTCGDFDVSLTVNDGVNPASTSVQTALIRTDLLSPSFSISVLAPSVWLFTDTTTPTPTAWAWDFENDGTVDATTQSAAFVSAGPCLSTECKLDVTLSCRTASIIEAVFDPGNSLVFNGEINGGNGTTSGTSVGNYFDMRVTAAEGIEVCGINFAAYSHLGATEVDIYLTGSTHVGKEGNAAAWRHVAHGVGVSTNGGFNPPGIDSCGLDAPLYLPSGNYGVAVYLTKVGGGTVGIAYTNGPGAAPYVGPDITFHPNGVGCSSVALLGPCAFTPRLWNGGFIYNKCSTTNSPGYGFFGEGCPGSAGTPGLAAFGGTTPQVGTSFAVEISNVPAPGIVIMITGLNNTLSANFGALPFDGTIAGAPGCFLRVADDATLLVSGTPTAIWGLTIPNDPGLVCVKFFNQALVFSPGTNAAGWVISDANGMIIGL